MYSLLVSCNAMHPELIQQIDRYNRLIVLLRLHEAVAEDYQSIKRYAFLNDQRAIAIRRGIRGRPKSYQDYISDQYRSRSISDSLPAIM